MIERVAVSVGREHFAFVIKIAAAVRDFDGHAARERHVAFLREQALHGHVRGDERGRAGGLHVDARTFEVEQIRDARDQEVFVVAGVAQEKETDVVDEIAVRAEVEIEIAAHAGAAEDGDRALELVGRMSGDLETLPTRLEEVPMLGIHDRRLFRAEAEELAVEEVHAVERAAALHVVRLAQIVRVLTLFQQLFFGVLADRFHALTKILPILLDRVRTR
jgi:hypothetical protein